MTIVIWDIALEPIWSSNYKKRQGLHKSIMELTLETARSWYSDADPVHDFSHIERVYHMATRLALAENADLEIVQVAALLHDAEGSAPGEGNTAGRATHHLSSAEFARQILAEGKLAN